MAAKYILKEMCFPYSHIKSTTWEASPLSSTVRMQNTKKELICLIRNNHNFMAATSIEPETFRKVTKYIEYSTRISSVKHQLGRNITIKVAVNEAKPDENGGKS